MNAPARPAYQERVVAERAARQAEVVRLADFIGSGRFAEVDPDERERMHRQLGIMRELVAVLDERIANFGGA